jgi:glutamate decarboxylase
MGLMCRRGFEMDRADLLLQDFRAALEFFKTQPTSKISAAEGTGFHHN